MSLESCPVCGYAVSTVTFRCRHCAHITTIKGLSPARRMQLIASVVVLGFIIYLWFVR